MTLTPYLNKHLLDITNTHVSCLSSITEQDSMLVQTNYLVLKDTELPQDATYMHTNRHSWALPLQIFDMREACNEMR